MSKERECRVCEDEDREKGRGEEVEHKSVQQGFLQLAKALFEGGKSEHDILCKQVHQIHFGITDNNKNNKKKKSKNINNKTTQ